MSLQFVFGSSGAGKSHYIYNRIIEESMKNPAMNYILLVPEQYSMALQRKMVMLHPNGGTMNIDVIGFNRLAYRVFDELNVKPAKVLEDFGKTMLIRQVAGSVRDKLSVYGGCLDKSGFIDEVKSLMSEMYQYDISRDRLYDAMSAISTENKASLLYSKLNDMVTIFEAFDKKIGEEYIVAEQLTEILSDWVDKSELIKNSVIVMDGFTGFTPIQLTLIERLMFRSKKMYMVLDMDMRYYERANISEHELFYLSARTRDSLKELAAKCRVMVDADIVIGRDGCARWDEAHYDLQHMEQNIFRYPYKKYSGAPENISIVAYDNPRKELKGTATRIRELIMQGYRYKDIAVITGDLEGISSHVEQIMPLYDIPYFLDYNRPVKNNPYIDALCHALKMVEENFSYDSVFAFLKSGVLSELSCDDIEELENYVLARGIRGVSRWNTEWNTEADDTRKYFMERIIPFYDSIKGKNISVSTYVESVRGLMNAIDYENQMSDMEGLYEKLQELLDKMLAIMPSDCMDISEFSELMELGLKDLSMGVIPGSLDMVIIGDITRTRLDDVRVLFVLGVNDGIIPKKGTPAGIISDREKEQLSEYGLVLAPTDKINAYIEQFYLYINMTKPKDKLILSYTLMSNENETMRPSYIIGRVKNIFPELKEELARRSPLKAVTKKAGIGELINGIHRIMDGDSEFSDEVFSLYKLYMDSGEDALIKKITGAAGYSNIPKALSKDVASLIKLRLMSQSVSRLEQFADCAYSYFLKYTIGLRERDIRGIDNRNIGNILHGAMESMYRYVYDNRNNDWSSVNDEDRDRLITGFVKQAFAHEYEGQVLDDGRYAYLEQMLIRIGKRTAKALCRIDSEDKLVPKYFEYKFKKELTLDGADSHMTLRGVVDRGDVYYSEETGTLRLRIIDYKSGNHDFKLAQLYEGLQLQLSVYMEVMKSLADSMYNRDKYDAERVSIVPEGMYYYRMQDPYVEAEDADRAEEARNKELKLRGLVNDDAVYFDNITRYAMKKVHDIAERIIGGEISKSPMAHDTGSACDYCAFTSVCRFDMKNGGNRLRYPRYNDSDKDKIYSEIVKELGGGQSAVD